MFQVILENGSLVIFEVTREDAGPYLCRLANAGGMVYHNTTLTVRSELVINTIVLRTSPSPLPLPLSPAKHTFPEIC